MVSVRFQKRGRAFEFTAFGHSGFSERGKDLVCSAVSILVYTLIDSIDKDMLESDPVVVMESGDVLFRVVAKPEAEKEIDGVFRVIRKGFRLLENNFPANIKIK